MVNLIKNRSGFKKADGTVPQLVRLTQEWSNAVDDGRYVAAVFFDLKKAFDRVWHEGLFVKLRATEIEGAALRWLVSFLADRHQMTMVNGTMSTSAKLFAGVPQGAILSPLAALLNIHEWHSFSKINKSVCGWHFVLCDRQCSQLVRIKAPRTDRLPFDMVCQVASDCKSNKICSDGFSFKEDAGRKHLHNSWLTPSTIGFTSPASWSHLLRHTGLDKPRRHHCKSSFGQSWVSAPTTEASEPVDHASAIHYLYSPVSRVHKHCLGWTDETRRREAWKMQPLCSSTNF